MADRVFGHGAALAYLTREIGTGRLAALALLMLAASLTEGIGLLLLVPIAQLVAGDGTQALPGWLSGLQAMPLAGLLAAVVLLVALRAGIVFWSSEMRRALGFVLSRRFRLEAHGAILGANWRWLAQQNSADHAALIIGEADRSASLANDALLVATAVATLLVLLAASAAIAPWLTLAGLVAVGLLAGLLALLQLRRAREGEAYWDAYARLQRILSQGLAHLRAARIAGAENVIKQDFARATQELVALEQSYFRAGHLARMIFQIFAAIAFAIALYVLLEITRTPLYLWLPALVIAIRAVPLLNAIHQGIRGWRYNLPALARLRGHIEAAQAQRETGGIEAEPVVLSREIALKDASLHFPGRDRPVFERFSISIKAGSVVGVAGPSGSGKSSLADLLAGLVQPDSGWLEIDGERLDTARSLGWRRQVGYVEQKPFFLDGSIEQNLCWGRTQVPREAIDRALERASATFVRDLPHGLATKMGESGRQFSGGELQRIALARALLAAPQLLILDEVTAGLDQQNREAIMRTVAALKGAHTILLLSHERQLLDLADHLVELGTGR